MFYIRPRWGRWWCSVLVFIINIRPTLGRKTEMLTQNGSNVYSKLIYQIAPDPVGVECLNIKILIMSHMKNMSLVAERDHEVEAQLNLYCFVSFFIGEMPQNEHGFVDKHKGKYHRHPPIT